MVTPGESVISLSDIAIMPLISDSDIAIIGCMAQGDFLFHLGPEAHERLRAAAEKEGISMAKLLREGMDMRIGAGQPGGGSLTEALRLVERAARRLASEASSDGPEADSWEALLKDTST
jgi:hypothetical protein